MGEDENKILVIGAGDAGIDREAIIKMLNIISCAVEKTIELIEPMIDDIKDFLLKIQELPDKPELPRAPKHLSNYKSIIMHHIRRLDKLYSPGYRLKAFEEVVT